MKKIVLIIIPFAIIILLLSCDQDENSIKNTNTTDSSYFPFRVGNEWIYEVMNDTVKIYIKITGTISFNNKEYYILKYVPYQGNGKVGNEVSMYMRTPDGIKFYEYKDGIETLFRDFSDIITDSSYNEKYITRNIDSMVIPLGKFYNCKNVEGINFQSDGDGSYFYAKGMGLISCIWFKGKMELIEAKLN